MPGGAPCRAGDREAENPETPPCEDGLSAASARPGVAAVPSHRSPASAPAPSRRRLDQTAMPPRFRTPPEAPLADGTIQLIVLVGIVVKPLFQHDHPRGRAGALRGPLPHGGEWIAAL